MIQKYTKHFYPWFHPWCYPPPPPPPPPPMEDKMYENKYFRKNNVKQLFYICELYIQQIKLLQKS